jgi:putative addiction module component (TIGR02574 family)
MSAITFESIQHLSVAERIQLVEDIWDSIAAAPETLALSETQRQELDNRLQAHQHNPTAGSSWAEVKTRLQS